MITAAAHASTSFSLLSWASLFGLVVSLGFGIWSWVVFRRASRASQETISTTLSGIVKLRHTLHDHDGSESDEHEHVG